MLTFHDLFDNNRDKQETPFWFGVLFREGSTDEHLKKCDKMNKNG